MTSGVGWRHSVRASLSEDSILSVWIVSHTMTLEPALGLFAQESLSESRVLQDNRPLPPVDLSRGGPPTTGYVGLASYNLLGNDIGVCPLYFNVPPTIISIGII